MLHKATLSIQISSGFPRTVTEHSPMRRDLWLIPLLGMSPNVSFASQIKVQSTASPKPACIHVHAPAGRPEVLDSFYSQAPIILALDS